MVNIIRNTIHLNEVHGYQFRARNDDVNVEARVKYLMEEYTDTKFASTIHRNNKAIAKRQDIFNVIQLQHQGITDIIFRMADALKPLDTIDTTKPITLEGSDFLKSSAAKAVTSLYEEFEVLTKYSNDLLTDHAHTYKCKRWQIDLTNQFPHRV